MESASGEPRWPAFTRTPYSYPGSLFTVLEARSRRPFGAWPRRVAVRRRRTLIFGRRTSTERLAADPRPHRVRRRLAPELPAGIARVESAKSIGVRSGKLAHPAAGGVAVNAPDITTLKGLRASAIIAPCRPAAPCARGTHRPPACSRRAGGKRAFERPPRDRPKELTQILRSAGEHVPRRWVLGEPKPADGPFSGGRITGESPPASCCTQEAALVR